MLSGLESFLGVIHTILWDYLLIYLLCGTGIYYTFRLGFLQVRHFKKAAKSLFGQITFKGDKADKSGMSSFQAVTTAVAGQIGTGNLVGPATAIMTGGPGAIFWMWISSFFGMATIYAEAILAQKFKTTDANGQVVGGPAYYIEKGLGLKWLAVAFAILIILALGLMGNMVQSNSIATAFETSLHIPTWVSGLVVSIIMGLVVMGGISAIANFTEKIVPSMAVFYLVGALITLAFNFEYILPAFKAIFIAAFNPQAVLGGGVGIAIQEAMRLGIARGLFSNEAGMGSTPHAHAAAKNVKPEEQGFVAMMGVFMVAVIVTLTGLVIISSGIRGWVESGLALTDPSFLSFYQGTGSAVTQKAYELIFGNIGGIFIAVALFFFAFSTIIGWYYYAETNVRYLFNSPVALYVFQLLAVVGVFFASMFKVELVWQLTDVFNGFMVLPNLAALLLLSPIVIRYTRKALDNQTRFTPVKEKKGKKK